MAVSKKIISKKIVSSTGRSSRVRSTVNVREARLNEDQTRTKKVCQFCKDKNNPSYTDIVNLRRFISDRSQIVTKTRTGLCSKHQRVVTTQIKYARHLALLPFVPKV